MRVALVLWIAAGCAMPLGVDNTAKIDESPEGPVLPPYDGPTYLDAAEIGRQRLEQIRTYLAMHPSCENGREAEGCPASVSELPESELRPLPFAVHVTLRRVIPDRKAEAAAYGMEDREYTNTWQHHQRTKQMLEWAADRICEPDESCDRIDEGLLFYLNAYVHARIDFTAHAGRCPTAHQASDSTDFEGDLPLTSAQEMACELDIYLHGEDGNGGLEAKMAAYLGMPFLTL